MRRRPQPVDPASAPPARLVDYDPANWLPLVDPSEYHPDDYRNRRNYEPYGEVRFSFEDWRASEAMRLWMRARADWCEQYGWPGGLDVLDLMREHVQMQRRGLSRQPHHPERER